MKTKIFFFLSLSHFLITHPYFTLDQIAPNLKYYTAKETLNKIVGLISSKQKGAYLRFGDGEFALAKGRNWGKQQLIKGIELEMRKAMSLNGPTILKSIPMNCKKLNTNEKGMSPGTHERSYDVTLKFLRDIAQFWGKPIKNVYSPVALHHVAVTDHDYCLEFLQFLKSHNSCILIGNENIPKHITTMLFGSHCMFIPTPPKHPYKIIDSVEQKCLEVAKKDNEYKVIIFAAGTLSKMLQKRLWYKLDNVFLFDFGSLIDALCDWNTREWINDNTAALNALKQKLILALQ